MTRSPSLLVRLAALTGIAAIVVTACGGAATPSASTGASAAAAPSTAPSAATSAAPEGSAEASGPPPSAAPAFTGNAYPVDGDAPCGVAPYTGSIKRIVATDPYTVEFHMCAPDVAFLPKVAFSSFGIQDSDYVAAHAFDKSILTQPNGTGPYKLKQWDQGNRHRLRGQSRLLGHQGPDAEPRAPLERDLGPAPARAPVRERRRHRQPRQGRDPDHPGRLEPQVLPAPGHEHLLHRVQPDDAAVRQRRRPQGHRHGHRPRPPGQELLPGWLRGRDPLHAVRPARQLRLRGR